MRREKSLVSRIISWIIMIILIFVIVKLFGLFKFYYFNEFTKAESTLGLSKFSRDSSVKYSENNSYKIDSEELNDAAFYKEIEVEPDTVYRVTCMVKTENVVPEKENSDGGANISIVEEPETSKSIVRNK